MIGRKKPCPACSREVVEDDLYCNSCGTVLFEFKIEPPRIIYYIDPDAPGPIHQRLRAADGGWGRMVVECEDLPEWLSFDPDALVLTLHADQLEVNEVPEQSVTLRVKNTDVEQDVTVAVAPMPGSVEMKPVTLVMGFSSGTPARLEFESWCPAILESMSFSPSYLELGAPVPIEVSVGGNTIPLVARVPAGQEARVRSLTYSMVLRALSEPLKGKLEIVFQDPPVLSIREIDNQHEPQILNQGEGEFVLTCANLGRGADLLVEDLQLTPRPGGGLAANAITFTRRPARAAIGEKPHEFLFQAMPTATVKPNHYYFDVTVRSNDPDPANNRKLLAIQVTDQNLRGFLALDYGTTDSTIAVFDNLAGSVNVRLERNNEDPKIFSNVYFADYMPDRNPRFEWEIGSRALAFGNANRARLVTAVKVRVGTGRKEVIQFPAKGAFPSLEPEEVVKLALRSLLVRAKYTLKQRPLRFAMCVPTRFTLRRKELLHAALLAAAQELSMPINVRLVDESLAAGVFSLRAGTAGGGKAEFTLMVVDFGGGTTDITVFRVKRDPKTKALLQVEIIGAWGVVNMGGEDITQEVAQMLLAEFAGTEPHSGESRKLSGESRKMVSDAERLKVTISELEELRRQSPSADAAALIGKLDKTAQQRIGYLCLFDAGAKPEDLQEAGSGVPVQGHPPDSLIHVCFGEAGD